MLKDKRKLNKSYIKKINLGLSSRYFAKDKYEIRDPTEILLNQDSSLEILNESPRSKLTRYPLRFCGERLMPISA